MLNSLNHLTLAVSDLARSVDFYHQLLGLKLHARWDNGAYLSCGELWLCLSLDAQRQYVAPTQSDYTHYAFSATLCSGWRPAARNLIREWCFLIRLSQSMLFAIPVS